MSIILVKFKNGLELIGSVFEKNDLELVLENVFQITYRISEQGFCDITLTRFMMGSDSDAFHLPIDEVFTVAPPRASVLEYYEESCKVYKEHVEPALDGRDTSPSQASKEEMMLRFLQSLPVDPSRMQ